MAAAFAIGAVLPLLLLAIASTKPDIEFWWDFFMGLGFVAAGGIIMLPVLTARFWRFAGHSPRLMVLVHHFHEYLSLIFGAFVVAHIVGLIIREPLLAEYLKLTAPGYMLAGLAATALIVLLVFLSVCRMLLTTRYPVWRWWHAWLSIATITLMVIHIAGAGYYVNRAWEVAALVSFALVPIVLGMIGARLRGGDKGSAHSGDSRGDLTRTVGVSRWMSLGMLFLWMAVAAAFAVTEESAEGDQAAACAESPCI